MCFQPSNDLVKVIKLPTLFFQTTKLVVEKVEMQREILPVLFKLCPGNPQIAMNMRIQPSSN